MQESDSPRTVAPSGAIARPLPDSPALFNLEDRSLAAEQYRSLAVQIGQDVHKRDLEAGYVLTVTSPDAGVGKTLTSLNLALTLARSRGRRVLLVEGDLWRPKLRDYLEILPGRPGFLQLLRSDTKLEQTIVSVPLSDGCKLDVVTAGSSGKIGDVYSGPRASTIIEAMKERYEIVIIDSPPLVLASGRALSCYSDGTIVVAGAQRTQQRHIEEALEILGPDRTLGLVLNRVQPKQVNASVYQAYTSYYESDPPERSERPALDTRRVDFEAQPTPPTPSRPSKGLLRAAAIALGTFGLLMFFTSWPDDDAPRTSELSAPAGAQPLADSQAGGTHPEQGERQVVRVQVASRVREWADSWSEQRVDRYVRFYSPKFTSDPSMSRADWEARSEHRLAQPEFIEVELRDLDVAPGGDDYAIATFVQDYRSDRYSDQVTKVLEWRLEDGEWRIVGEKAQPAP